MSLIRSRQGDESTIRLWAWRVIELTANTGEVYRHLIGHTIGGDRTSSPIVAFDTATMTATTRSGQRYELMDEPDVAGLYTTNLLHDWLKKRPITEAIDVSAEYQPAAPAVPSVEDEPTIQLTAWRVIELATDHGGWRHLIGWHTTARCARTSSPITMFDPTTMQVFTETGRRYELVGPPDPVILLAEDFWQEYFARDVTAEYWPTEDTR